MALRSPLLLTALLRADCCAGRAEGNAAKYSAEFTLDGEQWRLCCRPCGNPGSGYLDHFAAYLQLLPNEAHYAISARVQMRAMHPADASKYAWREGCHTFSQHLSNWGFHDLLTPTQIADYTHRDGSVVIEVRAFKAAKPLKQARWGVLRSAPASLPLAPVAVYSAQTKLAADVWTVRCRELSDQLQQAREAESALVNTRAELSQSLSAVTAAPHLAWLAPGSDGQRP